VGRRMGKQVQAVAKAVAAADPVALTAAYRAGTATVDVEGAPVPLEDGDLIVTETPREVLDERHEESGTRLSARVDGALAATLEEFAVPAA
jgi:isoleucyl-tRNA synthetase